MIRALFTKSGFGHTEPIMLRLGILKIKDLYVLRTVCSIAKIHQELVPNIINKMFDFGDDRRRTGAIRLPKRHNALSDKLPKYCLGSIWNEVLRNEDTLRFLIVNGESVFNMTILKKVITEYLQKEYQTCCQIKNCYTCMKQFQSPKTDDLSQQEQE